MLNGAAFVLIYALATIPLARIADMCGRKYLPRGLAHRLVRAHVPQRAVAEHHAAVLPARRDRAGRGGVHARGAVAHRGHVRPGQRASAMAMQQLGLAVGTAAANFIGGMLIDCSLGWRGVLRVLVSRGWCSPR